MLLLCHAPVACAGKLAEDEKQKTKVQRLMVALGAKPEEFLEVRDSSDTCM